MKKTVITLILICSLVFSLNLKPYLNQNILAYDNKTNTQFIYDVYKMYFNKTPDLIYKPKLTLVPGTLIGFNELKLKDRTIALPYNDMFHGYILIGKLKDSNIIIFGGNLNIIKEYLKGNKYIRESVSMYDNFKLIKLTVDREIPIINDSFLDNVTRKDYKVYSLNDNLKFNVYNYPKFLYRIMFNKGPEVFIRDNNEYNQIVLENYDGKNVYISVSKNIPIFQYKQALLDCYYTGRFDLCDLENKTSRILFLKSVKYEGSSLIIDKNDIRDLKNFSKRFLPKKLQFHYNYLISKNLENFINKNIEIDYAKIFSDNHYTRYPIQVLEDKKATCIELAKFSNTVLKSLNVPNPFNSTGNISGCKNITCIIKNMYDNNLKLYYVHLYFNDLLPGHTVAMYSTYYNITYNKTAYKKTKYYFVIDKYYLGKLLNYLYYIQMKSFRKIEGIEIDEIDPNYLKPVVITNNLEDINKFVNENKTIILINYEKKTLKEKIFEFIKRIKNTIQTLQSYLMSLARSGYKLSETFISNK